MAKNRCLLFSCLVYVLAVATVSAQISTSAIVSSYFAVNVTNSTVAVSAQISTSAIVSSSLAVNVTNSSVAVAGPSSSSSVVSASTVIWPSSSVTAVMSSNSSSVASAVSSSVSSSASTAAASSPASPSPTTSANAPATSTLATPNTILTTTAIAPSSSVAADGATPSAAILTTTSIASMASSSVTADGATSITASSSVVDNPTSTPATTTPPPKEETKTATMTFSMKSNEIYKTDYANPKSDAFKKKENETCKELKEKLGDLNCTLNGIAKGSIILNITIIVQIKTGVNLVQNITDIIKSGKLGNMTLDKTYIVYVEKYDGIELTTYKVKVSSFLENCCKSTIGLSKMYRECKVIKSGSTCNGIQLEYKVDCGGIKKEDEPTCKGNSLSMSLAVIILGYLISKIIQ